MKADQIRLAQAISALLAAAGLAAVLVSCAIPQERAEREVADGPTFVSLNPCLDAILVEVAAPEQILALSHYSRDPSSSSMDPQVAASFAYTGGTAEEVLALQPDIILASTFIAPTTRAALERAGMQVETFGSPGSVEESVAQVRGLAALTGRADYGEALAERIDAALPEPQTGSVTAMLWQPGQIVAGEATLVADHLRWAGLASHSAASGLVQADYVSLEKLLADPPQILLVAGDSIGQSHPLLDRLSDTMVAEFAPNLLFCGGPSIPQARARLMDIRAEYDRNFYRAPQ